MADHAKRIERLLSFEESLSKVRDEYRDEYEALDVDEGDCGYSHALAQYDGSETWIVMCESFDDAKDAAAGSCMEEIPWAPGEIIDLDTGAQYEVADVKVEYVHLDTFVERTIRWEDGTEHTTKFTTTRALAESWVQDEKDEDGVTTRIIGPAPGPEVPA